MKIIIASICLSAWSVILYSQDNSKWVVEAQKQELQKNYQKAARYYWKAVEGAGKDATIYARAGKFYLDNNFFPEAVRTFERSKSMVGKNGDFTLQLAQAYILNNDLQKAKELLYYSSTTYTKKHAMNYLYEKLQRDVKFQLAQKTIDSAMLVWPINLGAAVNTKVDEYFPSIHGNDEELIFTRKTNNQDEDFYIARRDSLCEWNFVQDLGYPFNSSKNEGAHFMSMDRNYMFYMRCGNQRSNEQTMGDCDLYLAYKKYATWSEAEPFGATINTPYYEGMPCLASDSKHLYFVSDKPGGYGGKDIYVTQFVDGLWQIPVNLGSTINSPYDELAPFLALDDHTLYFTSNGHPGYGGYDIFVSYKETDGNWSVPKNLGPYINTPFNETSMVVHAKGTKAYFASDRNGGYGGYDIYETELPQQKQPQTRSILAGFVRDSFTDYSLSAALLEFYDVEANTAINQISTNRGDGSYVIALPVGRPILRNVIRFGYKEYSDTIMLQNQYVAEFERNDVALLPDSYEEPVLEYDFTRINYNKNELTPPEDILTSFLNQMKTYLKPELEVQIYGYTDDTGNPYINQDYSYRRCRFLADELLKLGFEENQLIIRGWGEANPIVDNSTDENRYLNRRIEVKIIGKETIFKSLDIFKD